MIEKPFIPPNPDSHLISPVSGHQLFKGSSLAKSTAEIVADIFVLQQSWESSTPEPNKESNHTAFPAACGRLSDQHTLML